MITKRIRRKLIFCLTCLVLIWCMALSAYALDPLRFISKVTITDVKDIVPGEMPQRTGFSISEHVTIDSVFWRQSGAVFSNGKPFAAGHDYTLCFNVKANDGYTFGPSFEAFVDEWPCWIDPAYSSSSQVRLELMFPCLLTLEFDETYTYQEGALAPSMADLNTQYDPMDIVLHDTTVNAPVTGYTTLDPGHSYKLQLIYNEPVTLFYNGRMVELDSPTAPYPSYTIDLGSPKALMPSDPTPPVDPAPSVDPLPTTLAVGDSYTDPSTGHVYRIDSVTEGDLRTAFAKNGRPNASSVSVPSYIYINGDKYYVTTIAARAFYNNKKLTKVSIGRYVTCIGLKAFMGCSKLNTVSGGSRVERIYSYAFKNCKALKKITLDTKVRSIGTCILQGTRSLKKLTIKSTKLTKENVDKNAFRGLGKAAVVKFPSSRRKAYTALKKYWGIRK